MKVLFLSTWFPYPADNGSKVRVFHLLRALGRRHEVTLCSFAFDTARPDQADLLESVCKEIATVDRDPFVRSRRANALRFFSPSPIVDAPLPEMQDQVSALLGRSEYDLVIASTTVTATYALQASNVAKVLEEHNCHTLWARERVRQQRSALARLQAWVSWQKRRRYDASLYARFDLCTMVSERDREASARLLRERPGRVQVVPNGVDCRHNVLGLAQPREGALVYNGALAYSANYDAMQFFLSEVYPLIRQQEPSATLTVTGSTTGADLSGLPLDDSVTLSGFVDDVRPLVAGAWAAVAPILSGGGTRLKILEAMALGTPVIATPKGAEGLDVVDGEHLLLADDAADFARCTLRLMRQPSLRQRLAASARQLAEEHYDWLQIGPRFVDLVEAATADRNHL